MGVMDPLREVILPKLDMVKKAGAGFQARCPAHEDRAPSLSLGYGSKQPVVLNCHAGCDSEDILKAIGLEWKDLSTPREDRPADGDTWTPAGPAIAIYDYTDADGKLLYQVCRTATKDFRQRRPDPAKKSGWAWNLNGVSRTLYRLPKVIDAVKSGREVWLCEGEKDVHALEAVGMTATCNSGGAGKWSPEFTEYFQGAAVVRIVADADDAGRKHARMVFEALSHVVELVEIYESPKHKDAAAHLGAGLELHELEQTATTEDTSEPVLAPDLWEFLAEGDDAYDWLVPDVLERGDRLMITGAEGLGKSVWCRQLCVQLAAGIHPFQPGTVDPVRVLVVDCENSTRQNRRHYGILGGLSISKGRRVPDGGLRLIHRPEGIDLTRGDDAEWLLERVRAHRPDVLYIGPFYRLHNADINDEVAARKTVSVLDAARTVGDGCVLLMEAHAGHGQNGSQRALRPVGSSLLLRWPEFGFGLRRAKECDPADARPSLVDLEAWRGARDERDWPTSFRHGRRGDWPWMPEMFKTAGSSLGALSADALSGERAA